MKNLLADLDTSSELVNYKAQIHWISYVIPIFFILIGFFRIIPILIGVNFGNIGVLDFVLIFFFVRGIIQVLKNISTKIYVTDTHITFSSTGILGKTVLDISLNKLEGIHLHQNFLGRILNFGKLFVSTGGVKSAYFIGNPMELRGILINAK